ncbi:MAG: hypothetical protein ACM3YO_02815 [Bacteroidota bacterium]
MAKHYLPDASGAEQRLLADLAKEHPAALFLQSRQTREGLQLFFEVKGPSLERYIFFLIAKLRKGQKQLAGLFDKSKEAK